MTQAEIIFVLGLMAIALWRGTKEWKIIGAMVFLLWGLKEAATIEYSLPLMGIGLYVLGDTLFHAKK